MTKITLIPKEEFQRLRQADIDHYEKLAILADMNRANALASVKLAGSGHLGSSFSSLDVVTMLYEQEMNVSRTGTESPDRDIYFSSKGHDVPGQYAVLYALGILPREKFLRLRKLGGTFGHPEISIPAIEANTGSLGMGISKAKGMAYAKKHLGQSGRVLVMTGDGEFQEGQVFEALQSAVHQHITNLTVIIDHNKVQTDRLVQVITDLGDLETKLRSFGWHVTRCDGHDFKQLEAAFTELKKVTDRPKLLIADTIKGRGISFMEHPRDIKANKGHYRWHSGAPGDEDFINGYQELITHINQRLAALNLPQLTLEDVSTETQKTSGVSREYVADAYGETLVEMAKKRTDLVVLDADLAWDCRIRLFQETYPERFIENGIAEQDMVSMAGGLALQGLLPVVNSFAAFLAARANEQIYTNATEGTKIIYANHYAGLIPAGPGQSHQSIRDISLFGALPNVTILQPCNAAETRMVVEYCVQDCHENSMIRIIIGPSPRMIELPDSYQLSVGKGVTLVEGRDALLIAYGPVMLNEALKAAELLEKQGVTLRVVNMPWLNRVDAAWLADAVSNIPLVCVLEDHAPFGGLGDFLLPNLLSKDLLDNRRFAKFAVEGYPACGTPPEVLKYHRLDGASLARRITDALKT